MPCLDCNLYQFIMYFSSGHNLFRTGKRNHYQVISDLIFGPKSLSLLFNCRSVVPYHPWLESSGKFWIRIYIYIYWILIIIRDNTLFQSNACIMKWFLVLSRVRVRQFIGDDGFCCFIFMLENKTWLVSWCESYSVCIESFTGRAFHIREQVILPQYMFTRSCNPFFIIWIIVNQMCCLLYNQISSQKR